MVFRVANVECRSFCRNVCRLFRRCTATSPTRRRSMRTSLGRSARRWQSGISLSPRSNSTIGALLSTEKELIKRLEESEIDMSCKFDLFDVLDADLSGELEFEEMIDGLLKCRGPASKTDIIAIRLKTSLGVKLLTKICEKLGIQDD
mmetsp:Transcript_44035/g.102800  ORF Transcript_44035/g.102800 Transcript_44035/m.102800 type:complete len:147 (-) Transcript_44035:30-470(-)